jgi:hypothetical protein
LSPDGRIEAPSRSPSVLPILEGFGGICGFEQCVAQPRGIASLQIECLAEYPGLMPTSRMRGIQTIVLDLTHIEKIVGWAMPTRRANARLMAFPPKRFDIVCRWFCWWARREERLLPTLRSFSHELFTMRSVV